MKIVINTCFGRLLHCGHQINCGYSLSNKALIRLAELHGITLYFYKAYFDGGTKYIPIDSSSKDSFVSAFTKPMPSNPLPDNWINEHFFSSMPELRNDPLLIQVVEELGQEANGNYADLKIVEIPDDVEWEIDYYDGVETIHEKHRSWS